MKHVGSPKSYAYITLFFVVAYFAHRKLQYSYYKHCRSDIMHVIFFSSSDLCMVMKSVIDIIEGHYFELIRPLRQVLFV